jgi:hypothetical protein
VGLAHAEAVIASKADDAAALTSADFLTYLSGRDDDRALTIMERSLSYYLCFVLALMVRDGAHGWRVGACLGREVMRERLPSRPFASTPSILLPGARKRPVHATLCEDHLAAAISRLAAAVRLNPQFGCPSASSAIALALAGRTEEACSVVR